MGEGSLLLWALQPISFSQVLELEPSLRFCSSAVSFVGGGLCEYDVSVDPYKFITELAQVCETLG